MPSSSIESRGGAAWAALCLGLLTLWVFKPGLATMATQAFGDAQTDALRGAWGFHHIGQALSSGGSTWQSAYINFPAGSSLLVLPLASGLLLSPIRRSTPFWPGTSPSSYWSSPRLRYRLADTLAHGQLGRRRLGWRDAPRSPCCTTRWLMAPPSTWRCGHTAVHRLGLDGAARTEPAVGISAGLMSIVVALDSPYHAITPWSWASLFFLCGPSAKVESVTSAALAAMAIAACFGMWVVWTLYSGFDDADSSTTSAAVLQGTNATDLKLWWRHMGMDGGLRDFSRPPTLMPNMLLTGALILCMAAGRRGLPWMIGSSCWTELRHA